MHGSVRYSKLMLTCHWLTAVLVILAYLTSEGGAHVRADPPFIHIILGLSVLLLTLPRLLGRLVGGVPPPLESTPERMTRLARIGHGTLYFLLIAVPVTGWFTVSRLGLGIELLGFHLPSLTASVQGDPGPIANLHQVGGNLLLIIAGFHAAVALWHFFRLRDGTLQRMWPF
jgi:cytochrome b561